MNSIPVIQNEDKQVRRLAAQRYLYTNAKYLLVLQFILAAPLAFALALLANFYLGFAPYAALCAIIIFLTNFLLEKSESNLKRKAALIQELFDCDVLEIEWSRFLLKPTPDLELINEFADKYLRKNDVKDLREWYPNEVSNLPVRWACVLCQRINCWWNTKLHRYFSRLALAAFIVVLIALVLFGFTKPISEFVLVLLVPAIPFFDLCLRLWRDHSECADEYEDLKESIRVLWNSIVKREKPDESLLLESRMLQDQIFQRRKKNPLVFDWIYWVLRRKQHLQMKVNSTEMVARALKAVKK